MTFYGSRKCTHQGLVKVADLGYFRLFGGKASALKMALDSGYEPALALIVGGWRSYGQLKQPTICTIDKTGMYSAPDAAGSYPFPIIVVDWGDYSAPPFSAEWLLNVLETAKGLWGDMVVCCEGGHGRTGTVLSALSFVLGQTNDATDCISWIRKNYCEDAVESDDQEEWVRDNFDKRIIVEPHTIVNYHDAVGDAYASYYGQNYSSARGESHCDVSPCANAVKYICTFLSVGRLAYCEAHANAHIKEMPGHVLEEVAAPAYAEGCVAVAFCDVCAKRELATYKKGKWLCDDCDPDRYKIQKCEWCNENGIKEESTGLILCGLHIKVFHEGGLES